jgi:branched-chain amino acid transport system ATP-binding protein
VGALMLELRNISKRFGGVMALDDVTFSVGAGEIVGLMGANGAGKTTLFAVIAGNTRPQSGDVVWRGKSLLGLRPDQIARHGISRTFQVVRPFLGLTVLENASIAARFGARTLNRTSDVSAAARDALQAVHLLHRADDLASELTLSDQKRLEIARALATGAVLLLLDEVMAGLTPTEVREMIEIIRSLRNDRGLTLIVIEHVMRALMSLSDRIVVLHLGRRIAEGSPSVVADDPQVSQVYFGSHANA